MRMIMSNAALMQDFQLNLSARFVCPSGVVLLRAGHSCAGCGARAGATDFPGDLPVVGGRGQHRHIPVCGLCNGTSAFHITLLSTYLGVVAGVSRPQAVWQLTCCLAPRAALPYSCLWTLTGSPNRALCEFSPARLVNKWRALQ